MKYPMVAIALLYGGGLLLGYHVDLPLTLQFVLCFLVLGTAWAWPRGRPGALGLLLVLAGAVNLSSRTHVVSPHDLRIRFGTNAQIVTVRGRLLETPSLKMSIRDEAEVFRSIMPVEVTAVSRDGKWISASGVVLATTPGILPEQFFADTQVEATGVLAPPPGPLAEGLFDYRAYLRKEHIYYLFKSDSTNEWARLGGPARRGWGDRFLGWAQRVLARGLPEEDQSLRLLWAMTLGWKTALTQEIYEPFMKSGTMHIFAISGLHIALIAAILVQVLRVFRVPRLFCGTVVIPFIWFYTGATGWQPSAIRSTIMATVVIAGWALARPSNLLNSLAASAFVILLWDPLQLFGASFQLSFFVVLSIALLMPVLERGRDRLLRVDPLRPEDLLPQWQQWIRSGARFSFRFSATSSAAWIGALPLTAYYFNLFSPVTLLANILMVPCSSFALACNLGSLFCGDWLPWITEWLNFSAWAWMSAMMKISEWATRVPGGYWYVPTPGFLDLAVYYGAFIALVCGWNLIREKWVWSLGCVAVVGAGYAAHWELNRQDTQLTVLPLNGGNAVLCERTTRGAALLIDCGNSNSVQYVTRPFLRARGVNRLPELLLTHGDIRHSGGAEMLLDLFRPREVFTSPLRFRSPTYRAAVARLETAGRKPTPLSNGGSLGRWRVLHPAGDDKFSSADDGALVLAGTFHGTRVLLLSDLGRFGQDALLERHPDLRADIVVAGLPSQGEPLRDALLDAIRPRAIIIADSEYPAPSRASPALQERLQRRGVPVIYTRDSGAATIRLWGRGRYEVRTMSGLLVRHSPPKTE